MNPNVAPTEIVPIIRAALHGPAETVLARFGITMTGRDGKPRAPLLTDEPNALVTPYHDRMPLALADDQVDGWLDLSQTVQPDASLLLDLHAFSVRPMDRAMNSPRQKDLALIDLWPLKLGGGTSCPTATGRGHPLPCFAPARHRASRQGTA